MELPAGTRPRMLLGSSAGPGPGNRRRVTEEVSFRHFSQEANFTVMPNSVDDNWEWQLQRACLGSRCHVKLLILVFYFSFLRAERYFQFTPVTGRALSGLTKLFAAEI